MSRPCTRAPIQSAFQHKLHLQVVLKQLSAAYIRRTIMGSAKGMFRIAQLQARRCPPGACKEHASTRARARRDASARQHEKSTRLGPSACAFASQMRLAVVECCCWVLKASCRGLLSKWPEPGPSLRSRCMAVSKHRAGRVSNPQLSVWIEGASADAAGLGGQPVKVY